MAAIGVVADRSLHYVAAIELATKVRLPAPVRWLVAVSLIWLAVADVFLLPGTELRFTGGCGARAINGGHSARELNGSVDKDRKDAAPKFNTQPFEQPKKAHPGLRLEHHSGGSSIDDVLSPRSTATPQSAASHDRSTQSEVVGPEIAQEVDRLQKQVDDLTRQRNELALSKENTSTRLFLADRRAEELARDLAEQRQKAHRLDQHAQATKQAAEEAGAVQSQLLEEAQQACKLLQQAKDALEARVESLQQELHDEQKAREQQRGEQADALKGVKEAYERLKQASPRRSLIQDGDGQLSPIRSGIVDPGSPTNAYKTRHVKHRSTRSVDIPPVPSLPESLAIHSPVLSQSAAGSTSELPQVATSLQPSLSYPVPPSTDLATAAAVGTSDTADITTSSTRRRSRTASVLLANATPTSSPASKIPTSAGRVVEPGRDHDLPPITPEQDRVQATGENKDQSKDDNLTGNGSGSASGGGGGSGGRRPSFKTMRTSSIGKIKGLFKDRRVSNASLQTMSADQ